MDFIAMDFETANRKRASACSLAIVVVKNSRIADSFYTLINPEAEFEPQNIRVHGIHPADVANEPTFAQMWPHIQGLFDPSKIVAAHNASFDTSVLRKSLERYGLPAAHYQVIDTVKSSRKLLPGLDNYKLDTVSAFLNVPLTHHHNALADSFACARILLQEGLQFGPDALTPLLRPVA